MNWSYISGFFDADGSITIVMPNTGKNKTIQVSFHNTQKVILEEIRSFILKELGFKGSMSTKPAKKDNHSESYDLKYSYRAGTAVVNKLMLLHPKKVYRVMIYNKIQEGTMRNGKYTEEQKAKRDNLEQQFFTH